MRIIAGFARGRALVAPKGADTRPTLDRVRESLFSILQSCLPDARVLDLFAGSGALGLEALSRGAGEAVFVDRARAAQEAIRSNIDKVGVRESSLLLPEDWRRALGRLAADGRQFDLIFLDPPYGMPEISAVFEALAAGGLCADGAIVVHEHATGARHSFAGWSPDDERKYGDTTITLWTAR